MTGLSVLYASEATEERDWAAVPDRYKPGRLREVYWARRGDSNSGRKAAVNATLNWWSDRTAIGRRSDEPGDGFVFLVSTAPRVEKRFDWLEVTEVFTTVPASRIEGAMRAWNGIPDRDPVDFNEFRSGLRLGRPSRIEQRIAADQTIAQIERKLAKSSYEELLQKYGYGTLVVGLPLWFAVPPVDPFRAENAVDDYMTRTALGLEEVKRRVLRCRDCPFRTVIVTWDTTPEALRAWREERSGAYRDAANASLDNPWGTSLWGMLSDSLEKAASKAGIPESETPSMSLYLDARTDKKASGKGPYPVLVEAFAEVLHEGKERPVGRWTTMKLTVALTLCKLLCFVRVHGVVGLERWVARKFSASHALQRKAVRRRARRLYRESRRRGRVFRGPGHRDRVGGRSRGARVQATAEQALGGTGT